MIEAVFEISINLIETFISVDFITRYLGSKYEKWKKRLFFCIAWAIMFVELTIVNYITEFETVGSYIPMAILACYACLCLEGGKALKIWIAVLTHLIVIFTALLTNILLCDIIGYDPYKMITVFNGVRIMGVSTAKIMQFHITRILLKKKYKNPINNYKLLLIVLIPAVSVISLVSLMKAVLISKDISQYVFTGMICIVFANILTYYFFALMDNEYEVAIKAKLFEQYYKELKRSIADKDVFLNEMKTVRHDIKNQLLTIFQYAESGRCEDIKKYVSDLTNNYLPNNLDCISTNNTAIDAIVNSKIAACNKENIFMKVNIKGDTEINLKPEEIAVLFGNLLDNAIEAARETSDRKIVLNVQKNSDYLVILISNSIKSSVLKHNKDLKSTKPDKELHGIGVSSVKKIVEKHNGMIQFYEDENEFYCHIMINAAK